MKQTQKASGRLARRLRTHFLTGILVLAPIGATALILVWVFTSVDGLLQPLLSLVFGRPAKGVGFGVALALIYVVGVLATEVGSRRLVQYGQSLLTRVPIVNPIYTTMKRVLETFSSTGNTGFTQAVLVEFPRRGMRSIGFITNELPGPAGKKLLNIYIPASPNPTSGFLLLLPRGELRVLSLSIEEGVRLVISGGALLTPEQARALAAAAAGAGSGTGETA